MKSKVAIVAYGETMSRCPWDDDSFDFFTLNAAHRLPQIRLDRVTYWFQMHRPGSGDGHIDDPDHVEWLKTWNRCPVFMCETYAGFPAAIAFPRAAVTEDCGPGRDFFMSSIDYMVAFALHVKYQEIHLYGVDMIGPDYQHRKHSLGYYLGVARARGIGVAIPEESALLRHTHIYGYEQEPQPDKKLIEQLQLQSAECEKKKLQAMEKADLAYGEKREWEGRRKAYLDVIEILNMRKNGSTI